MLDNLGAAKPTEWARDTTAQVVGRRYYDRKLTILTTDYADARTGACVETPEGRVGAPQYSRLHGMCRTVAVEGEDYRRRCDGAQGGRGACLGSEDTVCSAPGVRE